MAGGTTSRKCFRWLRPQSPEETAEAGPSWAGEVEGRRELEDGDEGRQKPLEELHEVELVVDPEVESSDGGRFLVHGLNLPSPKRREAKTENRKLTAHDQARRSQTFWTPLLTLV